MRGNVGLSVVLLCLPALRAQEVELALEDADLRIEAKEWSAALEILWPWRDAEASNEQRTTLARLLARIGWGAFDAFDAGTALRAHEASLALRRQLFGDGPHADLARSVSGVAHCLHRLGRARDALPFFEEALALQQEIAGGADHEEVADALLALADCLRAVGRFDDCLNRSQEALAMRVRMHGGGDHAPIARTQTRVAHSLRAAGRLDDALVGYEQALRMYRRLFGHADHPEVASALGNVGSCLHAMERSDEALPLLEAQLAMHRALRLDDEAHREGLLMLAQCLQALGRPVEALAHATAAHEVCVRRYGSEDHPKVAISLDNMASAFGHAGRFVEMLAPAEASAAMYRRLLAGGDAEDIVSADLKVAAALASLGRNDGALATAQRALDAAQRLHGDRDHELTALSLHMLATCQLSLRRVPEALPTFERALAMVRRLHRDRDHPLVSGHLSDLARATLEAGRAAEALPRFEEALLMDQRLHGERPHPNVAMAIGNVAACLMRLERWADALPRNEEALAMWHRVLGNRDHPEVLCALTNRALALLHLRRPHDALPIARRGAAMVERLRETGRVSTDLRQTWFDALKDGGAFELLEVAAFRMGDLAEAWQASERGRSRSLLDLVEQRFDVAAEALQRARQRGDDAAAARLTALPDELADAALLSVRRLDLLARGAQRPTEERDRLAGLAEQADLRHRQLLDERARLCGDVMPFGRVRAAADVQSALQEGELLLQFTLAWNSGALYVLGPDGVVEAMQLPGSREAIRAAIDAIHADLRRGPGRGRDPATPAARADADAAARTLFSALVPPDLWPRLTACRRVFLAPHRELHRLPFELLVVGTAGETPERWLDTGPPIAYVPSGSMMHWLRTRAVDVRNDATRLDLLAVGDPAAAAAEVAGTDALPPLHGARAEAQAIADAFANHGAKTKVLLGADATESAIFDLAAQAKYVHFACHGIAEESPTQSRSSLLLATTGSTAVGNDGRLALIDLFHGWRARLASCRLVVLSACRTNVGPTLRDEAPQALPIGFWFAGAPAVISSLWAVDDGSTRELMTDFYARLLAGGTDRLAAFTAAKRELRAKYPDPFHWAPFLFLGSPE